MEDTLTRDYSHRGRGVEATIQQRRKISQKHMSGPFELPSIFQTAYQHWV